MKSKIWMILFLNLFSLAAFASTKSFSFQCPTKVVRGHHVFYEQRWHTYHFSIEVISDQEGTKSESHYHRNPFVHAYPGERYSIRISNPMPVPVAVNLMIDGLNSITGGPCSPGDGHKWFLSPHSSYVVRGWQVSQENMRRFYFTSRQDSYAAWRSHQFGQDLTVKCGVISAAYFFSLSDMQDHFERNPIYEGPVILRPPHIYEEQKAEAFSSRRKIAPEGRRMRDQAGTGMGERGGNAVDYIDFQYDTGMYREHETVKIFYDFGRPFPDRYYRYHERKEDGFSPEKP